jgi:hypothetical protein
VKDKKTWDDLIGAITVICAKILNKTSSEPHINSVQIRILASMFWKSVDTLRAIQLLYSANLPIQAQALIRILLKFASIWRFFFGCGLKTPWRLQAECSTR